MSAVTGEDTKPKVSRAKSGGKVITPKKIAAKAPPPIWNLAKILGLKNLKSEDPMTIIRITREGLPKKSIRSLAAALDLRSVDMAEILPISSRTIQRYEDKEPGEPLTAEVSDHMVQVSKVIAKATDVFEDAALAKEWLKESIPALGGRTPLSLLDTSTGIELVMTELVRIEYGVFS
jgi:putative toxin-antitoxin system antitoxin component (TIGR02293 family)